MSMPSRAAGRRQRRQPAPRPNAGPAVRRSSSISARPRRASTPRSRAEIGFVERLVWFWSNHFCVSADEVLEHGRRPTSARRSAPHVLGRFGDMLLAAESHPAMLLYLDNARSIGPNSVAGLINRDAGSTRTSRARSSSCIRSACAPSTPRTTSPASPRCSPAGRCGRPATDPEHGGEFVFNPRMHEPGPQTVLGKSLSRQAASSRAARCSPIWRAIRRPPRTSRPSSRAISSPTSRRRRWSSGWRSASSTPTAISRRSPRRWSTAPETWDEQRAASSSGRASG